MTQIISIIGIGILIYMLYAKFKKSKKKKGMKSPFGKLTTVVFCLIMLALFARGLMQGSKISEKIDSEFLAAGTNRVIWLAVGAIGLLIICSIVDSSYAKKKRGTPNKKRASSKKKALA